MTGPVSGQTSEQPGAISLKQLSGATRLGYWSALPIDVTCGTLFELKDIGVVSGNYNNLTVDLTGYVNDVVVWVQTFVISPGTPMILNVENPIMVNKFKLSRNTGSLETLHPDAVGTVLVIGGRPRPPTYTKSIFVSEITISLPV